MQTKKMNLANMQGKLSRNEMKQINGGIAAKFNCQCNGTGTWSGTYSSALEIANAINQYCANGGTCTAAPVEPI